VVSHRVPPPPVQLPDRIIIYELTGRTAAAEAAGGGKTADAPAPASGAAPAVPEFDLRYRVRDKIVAQLECNLLVVTSFHVILCQERKLQLYDFAGRKTRYVVFPTLAFAFSCFFI
jgi:hypothetical protein